MMNETTLQEKKEVLVCKGLERNYQLGPERLQILCGVDLKVVEGERLAIMGTSGAGKTTLLNLLGALDEPDAGEVWIAGTNVNGLSESARANLRNRALGFVFQFHHLLPEFSALENVAMPLWLRGQSRKQAAVQAKEVLDRVGMSARFEHRPSELSGGERQRVAIARALAGEPRVLLMDEPTGNLDRENAKRVIDLIEQLNQQTGSALVVVTHDPGIADHMDRQLQLVGGKLQAS